ncbi:hypothetical protein GCM10009530_65220 [Microbispora corallina]
MRGPAAAAAVPDTATVPAMAETRRKARLSIMVISKAINYLVRRAVIRFGWLQ